VQTDSVRARWMRLTLRASTGAKILVWRENDLYHAQRSDAAMETQVCLAMDLFEVIAELARLDLERGVEAAEAIELAESALRRLDGAQAR
jgi:hypothetical protein